MMRIPSRVNEPMQTIQTTEDTALYNVHLQIIQDHRNIRKSETRSDVSVPSYPSYRQLPLFQMGKTVTALHNMHAPMSAGIDSAPASPFMPDYGR